MWPPASLYCSAMLANASKPRLPWIQWHGTEPGIVRVGKRDGLRPDLVVAPHEGFGVAPDGARVVGDLGSVLVQTDAQYERVGLVLTDVVVGGVCVHLVAMRGFGWLWLVDPVLIGNKHVTQSRVYK